VAIDEFLGFRVTQKPYGGTMDSVNLPIRVVADDRENAGGVIGQLRVFAEVALEVRRLDVGDFIVADHFVVERKTLGDFATSVVDARLFRQAATIAIGSRRGLMILEGPAVRARELGVAREALQGALITVSVFYGLAVLRAQNAAETARLIVYLGRQAQQLARGALPRPGYRPKGRRAPVVYSSRVAGHRTRTRGETARSLRFGCSDCGGGGDRPRRGRWDRGIHRGPHALGTRGKA
jgi:ERCC4-type nuclease